MSNKFYFLNQICCRHMRSSLGKILKSLKLSLSLSRVILHLYNLTLPHQHHVYEAVVQRVKVNNHRSSTTLTLHPKIQIPHMGFAPLLASSSFHSGFASFSKIFVSNMKHPHLVFPQYY